MKFAVKALVAALALGAAAHASATINTATSGQVVGDLNSGGSELVFFVWDSATGVSFTKDLGVVAGNALEGSAFATAAQSFDLTGSSAWGSYKAAVGNDLSSSTWGVFAGRSGTASVDNASWALTTVQSGVVLDDIQQKSGNLKSVVGAGALGNFVTNANLAGHAGAGNHEEFASAPANSYWGTYFGSDALGKISFAIDNAVGTEASFARLTARTSATAFATVDGYDNYSVKFDGTALTLAPVPEPETYALMLAGLVMVGSIARRRMA